jgi:hypothetical protein
LRVRLGWLIFLRSHMMTLKPTRNKVPRIPKLVVLLLCQRGLEV